MANEITQELGLDASKALEAIATLNKSLAELQSAINDTMSVMRDFNRTGGRTSTMLKKIATQAEAANKALEGLSQNPLSQYVVGVNQYLATLQGSTQQAAQSVAAVGNASQGAAQTVSTQFNRMAGATARNTQVILHNTNRLTTSLALLSRIVFTQAVVRALSTLRNAFKATVRDAVEFQRSIALVTTIDDSGQSVAQLTQSVRQISDTFNIPLLEAAAGLYQTISNQIGDAAQSTLFLARAARFARATNSSLENSVDLLSGALKAYNLDVSETDRVATVMFKTIDLGRITADQLSNSFGRVGPAAAALGVQLEEVAAAISAISIRGSNTAESLTQFRNILTALVKPSDAMRAAMRELGFDSAEAAIRTLGLAGVIDELVRHTRGSAEALARLFPNVRGLNGIANLTADSLRTLSANIREMENAGRDFAGQKFLQVLENDAETVTEAANRLRNAVVMDLGQGLLKVLVDVIQFTGGVDHMISVVTNSASALVGFTASVTALGAAMRVALLTGKQLSSALSLGFLVPAAFGLGKSLGQWLDTFIFERAFGDIRRLYEQNQKDLGELVDALQNAATESRKADEDRVKSLRVATRDISTNYLRQMTAANNANDAMVRNTKAAAAQIEQAYTQLVQAQQRAIAGAQEAQRSSAERVLSLQDRLRDLEFERQTQNVSDAQKVFALNKRAAELASQAAREMANAGGNEARLNRAMALFQQAQASSQQAMQLASRTGDSALEQRSRQQLADILQRQVRSEQELQRAQDRRIAGLRQERSAHQNLLDAVREQVRLITDNTGIFNQEGELFSPGEQERRTEARTEALKRLIDLSKQIDPQRLRALGLEDFINQFESTLTSDPIRLAFTIDQETERIKQQLDQSFQAFTVELKIRTGIDRSELEQLLELDPGSLDTPNRIFQALDQAVKKADELRRMLNDLSGNLAEQGAVRSEIMALFQQLELPGFVANRKQYENLSGIFDQIVGQFKELNQQSRISASDFERAQRAYQLFAGEIRSSDAGVRAAFNSSTDALDLMFERFQRLYQLQQQQVQGPDAGNLRSQLQQFDNLQQRIIESGIPLQGAAQALQQGANSLQSAQPASDAIRQNSEAAAAALERAANAYIQASRVSFANAANAVNAAKGLVNVQHFSNGGLARGLDRIPAMLSPGETIINARSSRKFFSQLQALNAGQQPVYRQDGGTVTNIGDIHVNVQGTGVPARDARSIARELRRELRRGSSRL